MQRDNVRDLLVALLLAAAIASLIWPSKIAPWVFPPWAVSWAAPGVPPAAVPVSGRLGVGADPPVGVAR